MREEREETLDLGPLRARGPLAVVLAFILGVLVVAATFAYVANISPGVPEIRWTKAL